MFILNNFSVIRKPEGEKRASISKKRPIREIVGTALIVWGKRLGGRNRREEALHEIAELALLDSAMSQDTSSKFEGPWC